MVSTTHISSNRSDRNRDHSCGEILCLASPRFHRVPFHGTESRDGWMDGVMVRASFTQILVPWISSSVACFGFGFGFILVSHFLVHLFA